ncbi:MAG: DUF362 domain-containing protein [Fidelibacterota bacterium]|nr:MAG: DUF362 domain-containing protein [Candidatus Neomarinimicrobiota bacterium]
MPENLKFMEKIRSRKNFIELSLKATAGVAVAPLALQSVACSLTGPSSEKKYTVSIARIKNGNIGYAVEEAIDLLGGIGSVANGKERIMLKPNLVAESPVFTTKPEITRALAQLMINSGKEVLIGEGSASGEGFNRKQGVDYRTTNREILDGMQQFVFDELGYTELAEALGIPLINLHSGEMVDVAVPNAFAFDRITLHQSLQDIDLLCSVPMMKTHVLATVTLGMKNLIGLYPGTAYCSVRACVHDQATDRESPGVAFETIDMVRVNKLGLVVVDGSMAMEGDGPSAGTLVPMNVIIAGTNPLATDMVAASVMGFEMDEIPTFALASDIGMGPTSLSEIEVRGTGIKDVRRNFSKPNILAWNQIRDSWGSQVL